MVAAGLIIDDPSLLPVRRLVPLVGTVFFWFGFGLCLRNVCCGCRWAGPSPSGHFRCMAATRAFPREAGVACDSKRRCSRRSSCMRPWNSRLCHRRFFLSFLFVSVLKPPCPRSGKEGPLSDGSVLTAHGGAPTPSDTNAVFSVFTPRLSDPLCFCRAVVGKPFDLVKKEKEEPARRACLPLSASP